MVCIQLEGAVSLGHAGVFEAAFWVCALVAIYPYAIFSFFIYVAEFLSRKRPGAPDVGAEAVQMSRSGLTHIVAAHNEETMIAQKISAILSTLDSNQANEVIVVSDHSTDGTLAAAEEVKDPRVLVVANTGERGRAGAANLAVKLAKNEILIFSDVETTVPRETVDKLVAALMQPDIGCANAEIVFGNEGRDEVSAAAGIYWRFEMWLRTQETKLGLYATGSGPCMAVRRSLYRKLPATGDVDFTSPIDVIDQGYRCVHLSGAYAFDVMPADDAREFRARVRMVAKNFGGTISRWGARNLVRHPVYSWALYSHKIMRWLTPFFMMGALTTSAALIGRGLQYKLLFSGQVVFYLAAAVGWYAYRRKANWPFVGQIYAFVLANVAFALGVVKVAIGRVPASYVPVRQSNA